MESLALYLIPGYLIGSLPFAVIVSKLFGLADPRSFGSGNPGATNVLRSGNKAAAILTLLGDASKGWLAMWLAAIAAAAVAPTLALAWHGFGAVALVVGLMCLLLIWRHRGNLGRLIAGTENLIGKKKRA